MISHRLLLHVLNTNLQFASVKAIMPPPIGSVRPLIHNFRFFFLSSTRVHGGILAWHAGGTVSLVTHSPEPKLLTGMPRVS